MRLATLRDGTRDGRLIVVDAAGAHYAEAPVATLQAALEDWAAIAPLLRAIDSFPHPLDPAQLAAPLPNAWQWLDGASFPTHGELMQIAFGLDPIDADRPLMYQGLSDRFYAPTDDVPLPSVAHGIDFEGEFGVIVDAVPMVPFAGTVIGLGTVSNLDYLAVGVSCISEVRAIEMIAQGQPRTAFMSFGDRVRMEARRVDGSAPFGCIDQRVIVR